ncbi:Lecithin retinol acyltransferase [Pacmanvirus A23]|uniref:Lecithin retinol acyltransferase n=1 Tax=Pacmanvirus A23 TaxID=1932881 RepID=UPI000A0956FC|nr:Lecithin retinol acyltransferase [Pacmanvirus A23]SIP85914.1 Lecithin retinol acyltransferase [Pacmanvirus A23]
MSQKTDIIKKIKKVANRYQLSRNLESTGVFPHLRIGDEIACLAELTIGSNFSKHHGIVVSTNDNIYKCEVIHRNGTNKMNSIIKKTTLMEFLEGKSELWVYKTSFSDDFLKKVAANAEYYLKIDQSSFNIMTNNCEQFCIKCKKFSVSYSKVHTQIDNLKYLFDHVALKSYDLSQYSGIDPTINNYIKAIINGENISIYLLDGRPRTKYIL